MEPRNVKPAAEYLRRMAPTQSHEDRHNFQYAADLLTGLDLQVDNMVVIDWPVLVDGKPIGHASMTIRLTDDGQVGVTSSFTSDVPGYRHGGSLSFVAAEEPGAEPMWAPPVGPPSADPLDDN